MKPPITLHLPDGLVIRPIEPRDNAQLTQLIITVWGEYDDTVYFEDPGIPAGTSIKPNTNATELHPEDTSLFERYQSPAGQPLDRGYWVIEDEHNQRILGGGGFARLSGEAPLSVCELQKLYFLPELRGRGVGQHLLGLILAQAAQAGYREIYLESIQEMASAVHLYQKLGFRHIARKGTTGHWRCEIFMGRLLSEPANAAAFALEQSPVSAVSV